MVSSGLSVAVSLQDIFPIGLGRLRPSSVAAPKKQSAHSATRFVHTRGIDQQCFLQVSRVAMRAAHIRVNANAPETVPADAHRLGNFRKVSGVPDNDALSVDDGSRGVLDVSRLVVLAF